MNDGFEFKICFQYIPPELTECLIFLFLSSQVTSRSDVKELRNIDPPSPDQVVDHNFHSCWPFRSVHPENETSQVKANNRTWWVTLNSLDLFEVYLVPSSFLIVFHVDAQVILEDSKVIQDTSEVSNFRGFRHFEFTQFVWDVKKVVWNWRLLDKTRIILLKSLFPKIWNSIISDKQLFN